MRENCHGREIFNRHQNRGQFENVQAAEGELRSRSQYGGKILQSPTSVRNVMSLSPQKAESALAYELQAAKIRQRIRNEEIQIDVVERKKQIEIESQEIMRKDCELMSTVKLPAEAESYRVQTIAEGKRTQTLEAARAEAERIKKIGGAEALAIELVSCPEVTALNVGYYT